VNLRFLSVLGDWALGIALQMFSKRTAIAIASQIQSKQVQGQLLSTISILERERKKVSSAV
jgi:hypothetical protein